MRPVRLTPALLVLAGLTACSSDAIINPPPPPEAIATLTSPNGPEGAALVDLIGAGIIAVRNPEGNAFTQTHGDTTRVVIIRNQPGTISLTLILAGADTRLPEARLLAVAGEDDQPRAPLDGYRIQVTR